MAQADVSMAIKHIRRVAASNVANGQKELIKFSKNFIERPDYALEWGDQMFKDAAKMFVYKQVAELVADTNNMTDEQMLDRLTKVIQNEIIRGARFPSHSSSQCTNLMATYKLAAWADVGELVGL